MQTKSLQQLKRALSVALFVLLLSVAGMKNALAQNQVATLQHNDTITGVFYGQNAFVSAYNAAVNGVIITLSSGTFNKCDINKGITIRGAGCVYDTLTNVMPTIIAGEFRIHSDNTSFEGIWFTGNVLTSWERTLQSNVRFLKCYINSLNASDRYITMYRMDFQFVNCIVKMFGSYKFYGTSIINSVIRFTSNTHTDIYNPTNIYNSIVLFDDGKPVQNNVAYNSIIATVSGHTVSNCSFFNCIGIETGETLLFEGQTAQNVMEVNSYSEVFETFDGTISYENIYQLKNDIATSFLGHDGTEVGIYGGIIPYKTRPPYMILKNCNVAGQTDENKKLNVEMELIGPED